MFALPMKKKPSKVGYFSKIAEIFSTALKCGPRQGQLQRWTEHSTLIFKNLKPVEISKNLSKLGGCDSKITPSMPILVLEYK